MGACDTFWSISVFFTLMGSVRLFIASVLGTPWLTYSDDLLLQKHGLLKYCVKINNIETCENNEEILQFEGSRNYDIVLLLNIVAGASSLIGFFSAIVELCAKKPRLGCIMLTTTQACTAASCGILLMVYAEFALLKEMRKTKDFTRGWPFFTAYAGAALSVVAVICCWIAFCLKPLEKNTSSSVYYDNSDLNEYDNQPAPTPQPSPQRLEPFSYDNGGFVATRQHPQTLHDVPLRDYPIPETYGYTKNSNKKKQIRIS